MDTISFLETVMHLHSYERYKTCTRGGSIKILKERTDVWFLGGYDNREIVCFAFCVVLSLFYLGLLTLLALFPQSQLLSLLLGNLSRYSG
jgi:hypothetical protein